MAYKRKTVDVWRVYQNFGNGFECVDTFYTLKDCKDVMGDYRMMGFPCYYKKGREKV